MNDSKNPTAPKWLGPIIMALSVFIAFQKTSQGVPQWIGYVACLSFFLAGIAVTGIAFGRPQIANILGPFLVVCLAVIPSWIAFGPGERHCSGGISFLGSALGWGNAGDTECRIVFGISAVLMWVLLIWGIWYTMTHRKSP